LEEQKRIAAILDKADAIRRKRQQALRLTDDFLRSVFLDMFGDPVTNPKGRYWAPSPAVNTSKQKVNPSARTSMFLMITL
jgi:type I restriction enzyme, S subunit